MLLDRRAAAHGSAAVVSGLAQGSPLSPLGASLVLARFDVRAVAADQRPEAWSAGPQVLADGPADHLRDADVLLGRTD